VIGEEGKSPVTYLGHALHGQGTEKVILYNDWMGDCSSWEPVLPYLDGERFTYALTDLRGYGRSIDLTGKYTETEAAADTLALMDHLGWERVHLVGFSMTGVVVERLAIDVPERIKSVVAISAVSAAKFKMPEELRQLAIDSITDDEKALELLDFAMGNRLSPQWKQFKLRTSRQTRTPAAARGYLDMFTLHDFSSEAGQISVPFLVICGQYDLPNEQIEAQRKTFTQWHTNIEFAEIESGHYPMQETPVRLQTLMDGFLARHAD
jgi:3-oxoadipate enol-lactonase